MLDLHIKAADFFTFRNKAINTVNAIRYATRKGIKETSKLIETKLSDKIQSTTKNTQPRLFYKAGKVTLRPHAYARSIRHKVVGYKDRTGYIGISGSVYKDAPHAMIVERGVTKKERIRKRIGGKYAYLETLIAANRIPLIKPDGSNRRRTGKTKPGSQTKLVQMEIDDGVWILKFKEVYVSTFNSRTT